MIDILTICIKNLASGLNSAADYYCHQKSIGSITALRERAVGLSRASSALILKISRQIAYHLLLDATLTKILAPFLPLNKKKEDF